MNSSCEWELINSRVVRLFSDGMRHKQPIPTTDYGPFQNLNSYHHNNHFINPATSHGVPAVGGLLANQGTLGSGSPMVVNPIDRLYSMQNMYFEKADDQI